MPSLPVIGHSITVGPANTADPVVLSFPNGIPGYGLPNKFGSTDVPVGGLGD
jgi:hypothetical protein